MYPRESRGAVKTANVAIELHEASPSAYVAARESSGSPSRCRTVFTETAYTVNPGGGYALKISVRTLHANCSNRVTGERSTMFTID